MGGKNLKSKSVLYAGPFLILIFLSFIIFHQPILNKAGRFLAPTSDEKAEVVILEGSQVVKNGVFNAGMRLLADGKAKTMVVVLHHLSREYQIFAIQEKYPELIINELEHVGLVKEKVQIILAPIDGHPITLSEARFVVEKLSQNGTRSAILFCEGFHTRRSFAVYNQEGNQVGLHLVPYPYFTEYESDSWWHEPQGVSEFVNESLKLAYYLLYGYVSIKSLWY